MLQVQQRAYQCSIELVDDSMSFIQSIEKTQNISLFAVHITKLRSVVDKKFELHDLGKDQARSVCIKKSSICCRLRCASG